MIQAEGEVYFSVFAVIIRALFALCRVVKCAGKPGNLSTSRGWQVRGKIRAAEAAGSRVPLVLRIDA
jgi:hypothetical protein